ncbi:MAG: ankyrin repeat domain-containing protein [Wolbachia sp.]
MFSVCARARASRFAKTIKYTLLHVAIFSGRLDIVKHLIADKKADVDARGSDDKTALHLAASNGHLDTVKYFVDEKNVDVNQLNNDGNTALHLAAENGNTEIVKVLLNAKADPLLKNKNGKTPRDLATDENVKQLLEEAENKRVPDRENVHSIPNEPNNKPCADGANILHSTKGNKLPIITASAGLLLGLSIAYLAGDATLTPVGVVVAVFLAAAVGGALIGYGIGKFCEKVSEEKQKNPNIGTWDAAKSVLSDVFTTGHPKPGHQA